MAELDISVFGGTGFIGSTYQKVSSNNVNIIPREQRLTVSPNILYCIGTTDNYNVLTNPTLDIRTNIELLIEILEENRKKFGNFTFNYLSSWFVYGETDLPYRVDAVCNPKGFYSISKYAAEMFLISYCKTYNINYRILRLGNVFGLSDQGISQKKNALQYLIQKIKNNEDISLYEGGEVVRDYIHVDDVVRAIDLVLAKSPVNIIINIASGEPTKLKDAIEIVLTHHKSKSRVLNIPTPEFHKIVQVRDAYLDTSLIKSLGFVITKPILEEIIYL